MKFIALRKGWHITLGLVFCLFALASMALNTSAHAANGADLAIKLNAPNGGCGLGSACAITVTITNRGNAAFEGALHLQQVAGPKRTKLKQPSARSWRCKYTGATGSCSLSRRTIAVGETLRYNVNLLLPRNSARRKGQFCSRIIWAATSGKKARNMALQAELARRGFRMGPPDGIIGPQTRAAIAQFQLRNRLRVTGLPDARTVKKLLGNSGSRNSGATRDRNAKNDEDCVNFRLIRRSETTPQTTVITPPPPRQDNSQTPSSSDLPVPEPVEQTPKITDDANRLPDTFGEITDEDKAETAPAAPSTTPTPSASFCFENQIDKDGDCVCVEGYSELPDGSCARVRGAPASEGNTSERPACTGGKFRSARGECICPADTTEVDGVCASGVNGEPAQEKDPVTTPDKPTSSQSCPGKQILRKDGSCGCYLDLKDKDGSCMVKVRKDCAPGQIINIRGKCECPKGERLSSGKCTKG